MSYLYAFTLTLAVTLSLHGGDQAKTTPWSFVDLEGKKHYPLQSKNARGFVIVFITTDCPVANYYQPTLARLANEYQSQGFAFFLVHPDPDVSVKQARKHANEFNISIPVVLDSDQRITRRVNATVTPEAVVIDRGGKVRYQGRIDDTYVTWGKKRRQPTQQDLAEALAAISDGKPVKRPRTKPIGCFIQFTGLWRHSLSLQS